MTRDGKTRLKRSYGIANVSSRHLPQKTSSSMEKKNCRQLHDSPNYNEEMREGVKVTLPTFTKWLKWHIQTLQSISFPTSLLVLLQVQINT